MTTHDAIRVLSYFARKIDFAAGMDEGNWSIEEGERIPIMGTRHTLPAKAGRFLTGNKSCWSTGVPELKREPFQVVKCANA